MKNISFLTLLSLFISLSLSANISEPPRPRPGQLISEPLLSKHFIVNSEDLFLDLRLASTSDFAHIIATYDFSSDTALDYIRLVFVANNLESNNYTIKLDNQIIKGDTASLDSIPAKWNAPKELNWDNRIFYANYTNGQYDEFENRYILFSLPVSLGHHSLKVEYDARMPRFYISTATTSSLVYMLSPAKDWKEYHKLNLKIALPENWIWRSNLELKKEGMWLTGHWAKLPSDYVYIATRVADNYGELFENIFLFGLWGMLLIILFWRIWIVTRKYISGHVKGGYAWSVNLWFMVIGVTIFYIIFFNRELFMKLIYGNQLRGDFGHGDAYAIFGAPILWILGVAIGYIFQAIAYTILFRKKQNLKI